MINIIDKHCRCYTWPQTLKVCQQVTGELLLYHNNIISLIILCSKWNIEEEVSISTSMWCSEPHPQWCVTLLQPMIVFSEQYKHMPVWVFMIWSSLQKLPYFIPHQHCVSACMLLMLLKQTVQWQEIRGMQAITNNDFSLWLSIHHKVYQIITIRSSYTSLLIKFVAVLFWTKFWWHHDLVGQGNTWNCHNYLSNKRNTHN